MRQFILAFALLACGMLAGLAYALLVVPDSSATALSQDPMLQAIARSNARLEEKLVAEMEALRRDVRAAGASSGLAAQDPARPRLRERGTRAPTPIGPDATETAVAALVGARNGSASAGDPSPAVSALTRALEETTDPTARVAIVQTLASMGRSAAEAATQLAAIAGGDSIVGLEAAAALCRVQPRDCAAALDAMAATAGDERHPLRVHAIDAIAAAGPRARTVVPVLLTAMGRDATRVPAARAVCLVGGPQAPRALAELTRTAKDGGPSAVAAIGAIGDVGAQAREAVPTLVETLRAADPIARRASARALGRMGAENAVGALQQACSDADPRVRETAEDALVAVVRGR